MSEPLWLPRTVILATHDELLERFGGLAGIRDDGLLASALDRPKNLLAHEEATLPAIAAAYAAGIIKNHPFLDGNKRTGFMAAFIFLEANGLTFDAPEQKIVEHTFALAAGAISEANYAQWLQKSCVASEK